jgi:hypothetical protein
VSWLSLAEVQQQMEPAYRVRVTDAFADRALVRIYDGVDLVLN